MRDVPTMVRTTQAVRRWKHFALRLASCAFAVAFFALFFWFVIVLFRLMCGAV